MSAANPARITFGRSTIVAITASVDRSTGLGEVSAEHVG